ncbi:hypothetical protein TNCV_853171 [Trichonephila clavipes]|nr:hypothetical protein TNCV_853171 [Trichonephila clavipes]
MRTKLSWELNTGISRQKDYLIRTSAHTSKRLSVVPARISSQSSRHCWRSPLPHASPLIQRDFGCDLGVQQTKQLPRVAKVKLV